MFASLIQFNLSISQAASNKIINTCRKCPDCCGICHTHYCKYASIFHCRYYCCAGISEADRVWLISQASVSELYVCLSHSHSPSRTRTNQVFAVRRRLKINTHSHTKSRAKDLQRCAERTRRLSNKLANNFEVHDTHTHASELSTYTDKYRCYACLASAGFVQRWRWREKTVVCLYEFQQTDIRTYTKDRDTEFVPIHYRTRVS